MACALAIVVAPACALLDWQSLDSLAEQYVRTAMHLARHDPSLVEQWRGPAEWGFGTRVPVATLADDLTAIEAQLDRAASDIDSSEHHARVHYLRAQVRGLRFAADRQLGRATTIDEQAREEFGVTFPPLDAAAMSRTHDALNALLPGTAPLADRVDALRRDTMVPRDRREAVIAAAIDACRATVPPILPLPHEDRVRVLFKRGFAWDAFLRYEGNAGSELTINDDGELDVARALRLACHETYPGHHIQELLIDRVYGDRQWPELLLEPGFGPQLFYLEGAAEVGADLAFTLEQREALYRDRLLPAAGLSTDRAAAIARLEPLLQELLPVVTDVARQYLDGSLPQERAVERLRVEALLPNPRGTLAFIEQRRARALVYSEGRAAVYARLKTRDLAGLHAAFKDAAAVQ